MASLREYVTTCPSCGAGHPHVDEDAGTWRCACGAGGDLFDYVMQARGVTFPEALRILGRDAGTETD